MTSGQFLIDSEASLSGALERLNSAPATTPQMQPSPSVTPPMTTPDAGKSDTPAASVNSMDAMPGMQMDAKPQHDVQAGGDRR